MPVEDSERVLAKTGLEDPVGDSAENRQQDLSNNHDNSDSQDGDHDLEKGCNEQQVDNGARANEDEDEYLVKFETNDPRNPKNWNRAKKWTVTLVMSGVTFISPASSSIVAPAAPHIARDLKITDEVIMQITISIFVLAYAIGPLFLSPLSEIYGRRPIIQLTNLVFLAFNLACGFAQTKTQLIVCRFFAGLGGSAPLAVGGGIIGDIWTAEERGQAIAIYSLMPMIGPALGPIAGGFISEYSTWKWTFWATTIADGVLILILYILMKETYAPRILHDMTVAKVKETGDHGYYNEYEKIKLPPLQLLSTNLIRPLKLICTQPIIQFLGLYMAFLYGLLYIILTTFPTLWTQTYHQSTGIGGLHYIAISLGYMAGLQIGSRFLDAIYIRLKKKNNDEGKPEFRVPIMWVSAWILPIGLFWYGWSAEYELHWIMPDIGAFILCAGLIMSYMCIQNYVIDAYRLHAASALAAVAFTRSICGFAFPLFAPYMYDALGMGWGNSLLAFLGIAIGVPAPWALWYYGAKLRALSKYA